MSGRAKDPRDFWSSIVASRLSDIGILSPSFDASTEDIHRQALDDEISAMSAALSRLKERRNTLYRKPKFPPEVLKHIFAYVALNEVPGQGRTKAVETLGSVDARAMESKVYEILGWVKLTHVCRAWRAIALAEGNSWLWSTVDTGRLSAEGMYEILDRSHPHPITPKVTLSMHPDEIDVFHILLEPGYLSRLKSLQIVADEPVHPRELTEWRDMMDHANHILCMLTDGNLPAPGLTIESLAVAYDDNLHFAFALPYSLLAPHLRHLTLKNAYLSLDEDIVKYPQLTHLDITLDLQKATNNRIDELLEFLRGSPNLQVLRLIGSLPNMEPVGPLAEEHMEVLCVDLLHLEELRLDGTYRECAQFGQYLNLPDSCSKIINIFSQQSETDQSYYLLGPILRQWARFPVRLDIFSFPISSIRMWTTAAVATINRSGESNRILIDKPPQLHLTIRHFPENRFFQPPLEAGFWDTLLYDTVSFDALTDLRVYSGHGLFQGPQWWKKIFREARVVQRVSVDGTTSVNSLVSALTPYVSLPVRQRRDEPLFPGLKTLSMQYLIPITPIEEDQLRKCLQARRDGGLDTVMDIEVGFSDGIWPNGDFEASVAELEGLATLRIKFYT